METKLIILEAANATQPVEVRGPIVPRCLATLPTDLDDLIEQFNRQLAPQGE